MTVDDTRIQKLRDEVLGQLDTSRPAAQASGLEARISALEAAVSALTGRAPVAAPRLSPTEPAAHPSLQVLGPGGGRDHCVMEPGKPCVQSHACRVLGH